MLCDANHPPPSPLTARSRSPPHFRGYSFRAPPRRVPVVKHKGDPPTANSAGKCLADLGPIPFPAELSLRIAEESAPIPHFTLREKQVAGWLAEGKRDSEIAKILGIAVETVRTHIKSLLFKTSLENRGTFMAWIWRTRLVAQLSAASDSKPAQYS
jgi:DNA-binding CsgD family transcriptional regulator